MAWTMEVPWAGRMLVVGPMYLGFNIVEIWIWGTVCFSYFGYSGVSHCVLFKVCAKVCLHNEQITA